MQQKLFDLICAFDSKNGIGKSTHKANHGMLWSIKQDMQLFKRITEYTDSLVKKNAIIVGRTTFELMGSLPNRLMYVVTSKNLGEPNVVTCKSLEEALDAASANTTVDNIFVAGGGKLYAEAIDNPRLRRAYLTRVNYDFECDIFFPDYNFDAVKFAKPNSYTMTCLEATNNINIECEFVKYERW